MIETPPRLVTAEELLRMPKEARYELVRGELRDWSLGGGTHGIATGNVSFRLYTHVKDHQLGLSFLSVGYILERHPDTVLGPDVSFVRRDRLPPQLTWSYLEGAPDLAVEVVGFQELGWVVDDKVNYYLGYGSRLVWVIYPDTRTVLVYRQDGSVDRLLASREHILSGENVIPGFSAPLTQLFDW